MSDSEEIEAIKQLKARYCRTTDTKDWAGFRRLFADDVTIDVSQAGGIVVTGADEFVAFLQEMLTGPTVHQVHAPEIELTSPTTATGVWALADVVRFPDGSDLFGYGHYHETYRKPTASGASPHPPSPGCGRTAPNPRRAVPVPRTRKEGPSWSQPHSRSRSSPEAPPGSGSVSAGARPAGA